MAQTKRKRQTKHRGNAAGVVEARGRTGRKPTAAEKSPEAAAKSKAKGTAQGKGNRYDRPPTWSGAFYRSMAAAVVLLLACLLLGLKPTQAIAFFPLALLMYTPISYYTDLWLYRRRQRKKTTPGGSTKAAG